MEVKYLKNFFLTGFGAKAFEGFFFYFELTGKCLRTVIDIMGGIFITKLFIDICFTLLLPFLWYVQMKWNPIQKLSFSFISVWSNVHLVIIFGHWIPLLIPLTVFLILVSELFFLFTNGQF